MYFYRCPDLLEPGDVVRNGNWGRKIFGVGVTHGAFFREHLFEEIRRREFPNRPSRMRVAFAFTDQTLATTWNRGSLPELLYQVRPADPAGAKCELDMGWFDELNKQHSFERAEEIVRRYWCGERRNPQQVEVLFDCPLVIERRITTIPEDQPVSAPAAVTPTGDPALVARPENT